jgi:hypothetical protein
MTSEDIEYFKHIRTLTNAALAIDDRELIYKYLRMIKLVCATRPSRARSAWRKRLACGP